MDERQVEIRVWKCPDCKLSGWREAGEAGMFSYHAEYLEHTAQSPDCGSSTIAIIDGFEGEDGWKKHVSHARYR